VITPGSCLIRTRFVVTFKQLFRGIEVRHFLTGAFEAPVRMCDDETKIATKLEHALTPVRTGVYVCKLSVCSQSVSRICMCV